MTLGLIVESDLEIDQQVNTGMKLKGSFIRGQQELRFSYFLCL